LSKPAITCTIESFTASDGYRWRYRRYLVRKARAHIVCLHGIQSHGGWYEYSCQRLCQAGFRVSFLDRRGSGLNEEARGDAPSFRRLLDDIVEFTMLARRLETVPTIGLGISWGGKLLTAIALRNPGAFDHLMLLCPGLFPRVRPSLGQRLQIAASRLVAPRRRFPIPLNDPELFTANPKWQQFIRADPLSLREATARLLVESVRLDAYLRSAPKQIKQSTLLLLAEHDRIIDNARTRQYVEQFAGEYKIIVEIPGAHHTLEFEPDPEPAIDACLTWLDSFAPPLP
jgi:alpha-beta hydrolase superfamily lysophospholipase